jgi:hypothetical protein
MDTISEVWFLHVEREYSMVLLVDGVMCIHDNCEPEELLNLISQALPLDALEHIWVQDVTTSNLFTKEDWRLIFTQLPSLQQLGVGGDTVTNLVFGATPLSAVTYLSRIWCKMHDTCDIHLMKISPPHPLLQYLHISCTVVQE